MKYKGKNVIYTPEQIDRVLQKLLDQKKFGEEFHFRAEQRKTILKIAFLYLNKLCENVIIDAPTGSGKSVISIVTSKLLLEFQSKGFILTSNLDLQDQYTASLEQLAMHWGCVKGMDNYNCEVNGHRFRDGECRIRNMSLEQAQHLGCYHECGYYTNRARAINSPVSILNYSYWLLQMNYVQEKAQDEGRVYSFKPRDFTFFDEAHKIDDIVQNHFNVNLAKKNFLELMQLASDLIKNNFLDPEIELDGFERTFDLLLKAKKHQQKIDLLRLTLRSFRQITEAEDQLKGQIARQYPVKGGFNNSNKPPRAWQNMANQIQRFKEMECKIEDYLGLVEDDPTNLIQDNNPTLETIKFSVLHEAELIRAKLHAWSPFSIFMSATFGNAETWAKLNGVDNYEIITLSPKWDWSKSPIIMTTGPKLNYANVKNNLKDAIKLVDQILQKHAGERGLIHTVNYNLTQELTKKSKHKKRFLSYSDSRERAVAVYRLNQIPTGVLVGPSLIEGLDLKDDLARFQIFLKVPYRQLNDEFTKAKMAADPIWYNFKTAINFVQGIGRSKRSSEDWCITYLIDGCFRDFLVNNDHLLTPNIIERLTFENI